MEVASDAVKYVKDAFHPEVLDLAEAVPEEATGADLSALDASLDADPNIIARTGPDLLGEDIKSQMSSWNEANPMAEFDRSPGAWQRNPGVVERAMYMYDTSNPQRMFWNSGKNFVKNNWKAIAAETGIVGYFEGHELLGGTTLRRKRTR